MEKGVFPSPFADEDLSQVLEKAESTWRLVPMEGTKEGGAQRRQQLRKSFRKDPGAMTKRERRGGF